VMPPGALVKVWVGTELAEAGMAVEILLDMIGGFSSSAMLIRLHAFVHVYAFPKVCQLACLRPSFSNRVRCKGCALTSCSIILLVNPS
jgi:hypothetical protein